jgi:hypothetical protein
LSFSRKKRGRSRGFSPGAALFEVADAEDSEIPAVSEPFPSTERISLALSIFAYPDHRKIFEQRP